MGSNETAEESKTRLHALLLEGLNSGDPIPVDEEFWRQLRVKADQIKERYRASQKQQILHSATKRRDSRA